MTLHLFKRNLDIRVVQLVSSLGQRIVLPLDLKGQETPTGIIFESE
jgi:hypothetical protein